MRAFLVPIAVTACVPACGASSTTRSNATPDAQRNDAAIEASPPSTCSTLSPPATPITTECPAVGETPAGGTITDGTWTLTHAYRWASACGGYTVTFADSIRTHGADLEEAANVVSFMGPPVPTGGATSAFSMRISGTSVTLVAACTPDASAPAGVLSPGTYSFTATPTELRLFVPASPPELVAVFARAP
jgi:hypothetical protein